MTLQAGRPNEHPSRSRFRCAEYRAAPSGENVSGPGHDERTIAVAAIGPAGARRTRRVPIAGTGPGFLIARFERAFGGADEPLARPTT